MAKRKDHVATLRLKSATVSLPEAEVILVRGGARAYIWTGWKSGCLGTLSGPATLRRFARAILREIPAAQRIKRGGRDG